MELYGRYTVTLDPKGRLAIPARFRLAFPEGQQNEIILTRGFDPCITGYSRDSWAEFTKIFYDPDLSQEETDLIEREFIGRMLEATFDKQGRLTLPPHLIEYAQLENIDEVWVVGVRNRLEIWNPQVYNEIRKEKEEVIKKIHKRIKVGR